MTTKKIHTASGLVLSLFIGLHLFNHFCSLAGAGKHMEVMKALRHFYRHPFIETVLLSAVLLQIISGVKLFKANRKTATSKFEVLHIWTGLYLAAFLVVHTGAVLGGRLFLHLDTNFYFGVAGINSFPFNLFFVPYYGLAIVSFFGHLASVHSKKAKRNLLNLTPKGQATAIFAFGILLTAVIFYGLTNRFSGVTIPREYNVLIGK